MSIPREHYDVLAEVASLGDLARRLDALGTPEGCLASGAVHTATLNLQQASLLLALSAGGDSEIEF